MSQAHRFSWAEGPEDVFIARMARERKRRGWTLEQLAEAVNAVSAGAVRMHQSAFTKLEREADRRNLRLDEAVFIAEALGLSLPQMLADDDLDGASARIRDLQQQHRELMNELTEVERRHNSITSRMAEIGAEVGRLQESREAEVDVRAEIAAARAALGVGVDSPPAQRQQATGRAKKTAARGAPLAKTRGQVRTRG